MATADALQAMAQAKGVTVAQLAIAWVLAQGKGDILALVGSHTPQQVADTAAEELQHISGIIPKEKVNSSYMIDLQLDEKGLIQNF